MQPIKESESEIRMTTEGDKEMTKAEVKEFRQEISQSEFGRRALAGADIHAILRKAATLTLEKQPKDWHRFFLSSALQEWEQANKRRLTDEEVNDMMESAWTHHRDYMDHPFKEEPLAFPSEGTDDDEEVISGVNPKDSPLSSALRNTATGGTA
jgi:hypothetical protein